MFAKRLLSNDVTDREVEEIIHAKNTMLDSMGVYQHHDAVSGTSKQHVADNYVEHLSKSMGYSSKIYNREILKEMEEDGFLAETLENCVGAQNDTVLDCPIDESVDEFIVAVHNPSALRYEQLVRI